MIYVESEHPPGVVAFIGQETARYHSFTMCFTGLNVPAGSKLYNGAGYDAAYNRNAVIEFALDGCDLCSRYHRGKDIDGCPGFVENNMQWVNLWDDDHVFAPDVLLRLLDHQVPVVVPYYKQRQPPCRPCIFKNEREDGAYEIYTEQDLEGASGLLPVASAGAGGCLIRRPVLEAIPNPWFERVGKIGEDHIFFKRCREHGFQPYSALDIPIGHSTIVEVWPHRNEQGQWGTKIDLKGAPPNIVELWHDVYRPKS